MAGRLEAMRGGARTSAGWDGVDVDARQASADEPEWRDE